MIVRPSTGWQTILADLSMILFMIAASALANTPEKAQPVAKAHAAVAHTPPPAPVQASVRAEPVGVWSDGAGAPPLAQWLADQGSDPRLRVTIVVRHGPGDQAAAFARAAALAQSAGERGKNARVVVEPGISRGATVTLGFDAEESASAT